MNEHDNLPENFSGKTSLPPQVLENERDNVIRILTESFSRNLLSLEEFENRAALAETSSTMEEFRNLVKGLPSIPEPPVVAVHQAPVLSEETETFTGIMSSRRLRGDWLRSAKNRILGIMSSQEFDFRETEIPQSGIELQITSVMADIKITVPPGVDVRLEVLPIMADVSEDKNLRSARYPKGTPIIRVTGTAVMSDIKVRCRS